MTKSIDHTGSWKHGYADDPSTDAINNVEPRALWSHMSRQFDEETIEHIKHVVFPEALAAGNKEVATAAEEVLTKYGYAQPNHVTGMWVQKDVPSTEVQVREMFAPKMPEYGYQIVRSGEAFPDWLLLDRDGKFIYTEIEHRSSDFMAHNHDLTMVDLIICWEHDADIELLGVSVLELFTDQRYEPINRITAGDRSGLPVHWAGKKSRPHPQMGKYRYGKNTSAERYATIGAKVGALREGGDTRKDAVLKVAREYDLSPATVDSYLSRFKHGKK